MYPIGGAAADVPKEPADCAVAREVDASVATPIHLDWTAASRASKQSNIEMRIRREWEANDSHRVNTVLKTWLKDREQERVANAKQKAELVKQLEEGQKMKLKKRKEYQTQAAERWAGAKQAAERKLDIQDDEELFKWNRAYSYVWGVGSDRRFMVKEEPKDEEDE